MIGIKETLKTLASENERVRDSLGGIIRSLENDIEWLVENEEELFKLVP